MSIVDCLAVSPLLAAESLAAKAATNAPRANTLLGLARTEPFEEAGDTLRELYQGDRSGGVRALG